MSQRRSPVAVVALAVLLAMPSVAPAGEPGARVVDLQDLPVLDTIVRPLSRQRVVYVGEMHDRYAHHLNQLALLKQLHAANSDLALGVEFFQQPFQKFLDDYVEGRIDTAELLKRTEYYRRWHFDFRLYAPILAYARERRIPIVALNVPTELVNKVARGGFEALTPAERAEVPKDIDRSDQEYRERLRAIYAEHPGSDERSFEHFLDVQLLWDEGMAARAAAFLQGHPARRLVVLAGSGHLVYGAGIPRRVARRMPVSSAIVLPADGQELSADLADYLLLSPEQSLPPAGTLGVVLDTDGVTVAGFADGSAAQAAGLREHDQIVALAGQPVATIDDIKSMLWDKRPGERVSLTVSRGLFKPTEQRFEVELRDHGKR